MECVGGQRGWGGVKSCLLLLPCKNQAKHQSFALRFKCPDQSRAPGRKSQFGLEPEKSFSAHFWEVKQLGFGKLPSKGYLEGRRVSAGAEEVALSLSSQTGNYYWPLDHNTPHDNTRLAPLRLSPKGPCSSTAFRRRMSLIPASHSQALVSPRPPHAVFASWRSPEPPRCSEPNAQSLQRQLMSKLGFMASGTASGPQCNIWWSSQNTISNFCFLTVYSKANKQMREEKKRLRV